MEKEKFGLTKRDWNTIINIIKKYPIISKINLFGSRAKGNFKKGSDIDLALMDENLEPKMVDKLKIDFEESSLPYNVDLVDYHHLESKELKDHIDRVGILFFSKHENRQDFF